MISSSHLVQANNPIIGIKFGSFTTVLGTVNNLLLDILFSETSSRTIPSIVSYSNNFIFGGDAALNTLTKNASNTFRYLNRLLCLSNESSSFISNEEKWITCSIDKSNNSFLYNNLPIESIIASFFYKLRKTWKNKDNNKHTNDIVISVPDYYTPFQRISMLNAIKIANLNCIAMINESSAICLSYFFHHYREISLSSIPQIVVFIDMGDAKTSLHICSFTKNNPQIIFSKSDKLLGCRDFDSAIFNYLESEYNDVFSAGINQKMKIKIMEIISKNRKILTVNNETILNFEINNTEISFTLTRDKLREIAQFQIEKFNSLITSSIEESHIDINSIKSIEMVGDAIRNPLFHDIIQNSLKKTISKTLLADECIARGCALYNVMLNPKYSTLNDFEFTQYNSNDIKLSFKNMKIDTEFILLPKGGNYPIKKMFRFKSKDIHDSRNKNVIVNIYFSSTEIINTTKIYLPYLDDESYTLIIEALVDVNCIPKILNGFIIYDNKLPQRCVMETSFEFDSIEGKGKKLSDLIVNELETEFNDYLSTCIINRRNEVESIAYEIRDQIDSKLNTDQIISEIGELTEISKLNEKYENIVNQYKMTKDFSFIEIQNAIIENINLLLGNKEKISKEKFIEISKHLKKVIDEEEEIKQSIISNKEIKNEKIEMINLYKNEIQ